MGCCQLRYDDNELLLTRNEEKTIEEEHSFEDISLPSRNSIQTIEIGTKEKVGNGGSRVYLESAFLCTAPIFSDNFMKSRMSNGFLSFGTIYDRSFKCNFIASDSAKEMSGYDGEETQRAESKFRDDGLDDHRGEKATVRGNY